MRNLAGVEKMRIGIYRKQGFSITEVAKRLNRPWSTVQSFINSRVFEELWSFGWHPSRLRYQGVDCTCTFCGTPLHFDTDGQGRLTEYCPNHGYASLR